MTADINVGVLMFIASRAIENRVVEAVRKAGHVGITIAQGRIAARIAEGGSRVSDLADQAQVTKQTATHLVDQLERAGYVERTVDPTDARARLVRFTALGEAVIAIARKVEAEIDAEWTAHLGADDMARMHETLTRLRTITDPYM